MEFEKTPYRTEKTRVNYELWIHRIPDHLVPPFPPEKEHLQDTYDVWKRVVDAGVCWRIVDIDLWNNVWIDVRFKNDKGELEHHSLAIDPDCCEKIESVEYEVDIEVKVDEDDGPET